MKLLLQLLFVQGWLWRDRFPEVLARSKVQHTRIGQLLVIAPILLLLVGATQIADSASSEGAALLALGGSWLLWYISSLGISEGTRWKEARSSASWATGFLFLVTLFASIGVGVVTQDWSLLPAYFLFLLCPGSSWMRAIQANYLFFRDPADNAWRLEEQPAERGLLRPLINLWVETYWRLPSEILFPQRERHA